MYVIGFKLFLSSQTRQKNTKEDNIYIPVYIPTLIKINLNKLNLKKKSYSRFYVLIRTLHYLRNNYKYNRFKYQNGVLNKVDCFLTVIKKRILDKLLMLICFLNFLKK